jgi:hypothetical protein
MSRQSKNARLRKDAKVITAMHLKGERGPSKTQKLHTKKYENTLNYKRKIAYKAKELSLAEQALAK